MKLTVEKFKRSAKRLADHTSKPLNEAQELLATSLGLGNFNAALASLNVSDETPETGVELETVERPEPRLPEQWQGRPTLDLYLRLFEVAGHAFGQRNARVNLLLPVAYACLPSVLEADSDAMWKIKSAATPAQGIKEFTAAARKMLWWENIIKLFQKLRDQAVNDDKLKSLKAYVFSERGLNADPLLESKFVDVFSSINHEGTDISSLNAGFGGISKTPVPLMTELFIPSKAQADHNRILAVLMNALEPAMQELMRALKPEYSTDQKPEIMFSAVFESGDAKAIMQVLSGFLPRAAGEALNWHERALHVARAVVNALCYLRDTSDFKLTPATFAEHMSLHNVEKLYIEGYLLAFSNGMNWLPAFNDIKLYLEAGSLPGFKLSRVLAKYGFNGQQAPSVVIEGGRPLLPKPNSMNNQEPSVVEHHLYRVMQWGPALKTFGATIDGLPVADNAD